MSFKKRFWKKTKRIVLLVIIIQLVYLVVLKWVFPPVTIIQLNNWMSGYGLKRDYVPLKEISPDIALAVIAAEDQRFAEHNGFDWNSIEKAIKHNKRKPNRVRGASTISQQVAKNVFLWNGRSWFRKGLEVYFTFMIEMIWGKERILEMYLNVAEMGKGVFGAEAAAQRFYKKPAKKLTRSEAAMIAASLPNPKKYTVKPVSKYVSQKSVWIKKQMRNLEHHKPIKELLNLK